MTTFAERLIARMEPWNVGPKVKGLTDLERYLKAIAVQYEPFLELCEESGEDGHAAYVPAWGKLFNPTECPKSGLAYLGQYVGVAVPTGATEAEARQLVKEHAGFERGTQAALEAAVLRVIGAKESFSLLTRTEPNGSENAYFFVLIVPSGKKTNALLEAINAAIPAGIFYEVKELKNTWLQGAKKWSEIAAGVKWNKPIVEGEY